jgi:TRAP-type C4-dicarboxylate transport system permease small subunit
MLDRAASYFGRVLEFILLLLMLALTTLVVVAVVYRKVLENSLSWYDEVASIMLIWVTYYGAALAALRRKHIGFDGVLLALPLQVRTAAFIIAEVLVIGFFVMISYGGWLILGAVQGGNLVSLTWISLQWPMSVILVAGVLFIMGELLSIPTAWKAMRAGVSLEHKEIEEEIEVAQSEAQRVEAGLRSIKGEAAAAGTGPATGGMTSGAAGRNGVADGARRADPASGDKGEHKQ